MTWKLQTITGEFTGKEISVERDMLVGRHQDADLVLQSGEISRRHAALLLKDGALWVQDLKSSNGTFVNDVRVEEHEVLVKDGDILQFAGQKFSVLAPAKHDVAKSVELNQPSEAVATSEIAQEQAKEKTPAEHMIDQGMPDLKERDTSVQLNRDGMPQNVGIPKPAPIPENVDVSAHLKKNEACEVDIPATCANKEEEAQKNASIGLMALIAIILVAIIAWFVFN